MERLSRKELADLVSSDGPGISSNQRDEMAIPTYLHWNPLIQWLFWRRYEVIAKMLGRRGDDAILEFGCGIGTFLPELARHHGKVYAIDLVPHYAKLVDSRMNLGIIFPGSIDEVADRSLNAIVAADVLEHVENLQALLVSMRSKLADDGTLIISGPTENIAYRIGRFFAGFGGKADYHHTNIDHIIQTALSVGFRIVGSVDLPFPLPPTLFRVCALARG